MTTFARATPGTVVFEQGSFATPVAIFTLLVVLLVLTPSTFAEQSECKERALSTLLGVYYVHKVIGFRGGLTTEANAIKHVGKHVQVTVDLFKSWDADVSDPTYRIECHPLLPEGEVAVKRWSNFYGLGMDRTSIDALRVYSKSDLKRSRRTLEIVGDDLWMPWDGWMYVLKKEGSKSRVDYGTESATLAPIRVVPGSTFRDALRSGGEGPVMVVIPAGSFQMGCLSNDNDCLESEKPVHRVTIAREFAVSQFEVTYEDYDRFTYPRKWDADTRGRDRLPVSVASWYDAIGYVAWLSMQTGEEYRLLSEAEWEYAARAVSGASAPPGVQLEIGVKAQGSS